MQDLNKKVTVLLLAILLIIMCFSACAPKGNEESEIVVSEDESMMTPDHDEEEPLTSESAKSLAALAQSMWAENADTVGWLKMPNTEVDDVVLFTEDDNHYYERKNFEGRYSFNGSYYADMRSIFGNSTRDQIGKNTVIYGHSMSDDKDDVKFGPMRYYLEEGFAINNPYIMFSTTDEDMLWEVFSTFYIHFDVPYNRTDLSQKEFDAMIKDVLDHSVFDYKVDLNPNDKFLTLSTCVYSLPDVGDLHEYPNQYRLGIMARLVGKDEALKDKAVLTINSDVKSAVK